jgi:hypothetical protein
MQDLIKYLTDYFKKNGKMPTAKEVAQKINRSEQVASQLLEKLKKQGALGFYDGNYYIPNLKEQPVKKAEPVVKEASTTTPSNKKNIVAQIFSAINNFLFNESLTEKISENIIKIVMLVISIGCMIVSSNNTYEYFTNYLNGMYCLIAAGSIVTFSVFGFPASSIVRKKGNKLFAWLLVVASIVALCICMVSTIHTQYKNNKITEVASTQLRETKGLEALEKVEKELELNISQVNKQIDSNQKRLDVLMNKDSLSKDEQREYNNLNYNNSLLRNRIETYNSRLTPIREELQRLYKDKNVIVKEGNTTTQKDFYSNLSNIFFNMIDAQRIANFLYMLFGIFLDLLAPLGIMVFLGHYKKSSDNKKTGLFNLIINRLFNNNKISTNNNPEPPAQ